MEPFMSAAPRPYSMPSRMVGVNGSLCHLSTGPVGTTSVWPAKQTSGVAAPRPQIVHLAVAHHLQFEADFFQALADDVQAAVILWGE